MKNMLTLLTIIIIILNGCGANQTEEQSKEFPFDYDISNLKEFQVAPTSLSNTEEDIITYYTDIDMVYNEYITEDKTSAIDIMVYEDLSAKYGEGTSNDVRSNSMVCGIGDYDYCEIDSFETIVINDNEVDKVELEIVNNGSEYVVVDYHIPIGERVMYVNYIYHIDYYDQLSDSVEHIINTAH